MIPDEWRCDNCGNELDEDGNGQPYCPNCKFQDMLSMGELDEEIIDGEEYTRIGGWTFRLPQYAEDADYDDAEERHYSDSRGDSIAHGDESD